ncbi:putative ribosomal protein L28e [Helianthus debilis subsp. tardiflorus]
MLATTKTKKQGKPASLLHKSILKKEFYPMANAVSNQVADNYYRPDLKKAALARLSAVKVSKSGVKKKKKKKNIQASKIRGRKLNQVYQLV